MSISVTKRSELLDIVTALHRVHIDQGTTETRSPQHWFAEALERQTGTTVSRGTISRWFTHSVPKGQRQAVDAVIMKLWHETQVLLLLMLGEVTSLLDPDE